MAAYRDAMMAERARRAAAKDPNAKDGVRAWALSFANRPVEFIGEIMGDDWWTSDWAAWRSVTRAAFGLPMPDDELAIYREWTGRLEPPATRQREVWLPIGRRGGKSRWEAMIGVYFACCEDWSPYLAPGELGFVRVLANNRPNSGAIMGYAKAALRHPRLSPLVVKDLAESVQLIGSTIIEVGTASIGAVRSRTIIVALCDEIAFWEADEESANPDAEVLNALRPAMITIPGSMVIGASNPYARKGVLWDAFRRWHSRDDGELVWKAPTWAMHPSLPREHPTIEAEYDKDPISAAAEYGAEFRTDVLGFLSSEALDSVVPEGRHELPPVLGRQYRAFTDPSGGSSDSMTLAIAHADSDGRGILDLLRERRPPFSPDAVAAEFAAECHRYGASSVTGDAYAGEWPRERFARYGIAYEVSEMNKSAIYQAWLPLVNAGRVDLLDDRRMVAQALGLERRVTRGGRDSIDHSPGGHDDVVNAAAGALVLATGDRYPAMWTLENMMVVA